MGGSIVVGSSGFDNPVRVVKSIPTNDCLRSSCGVPCASISKKNHSCELGVKTNLDVFTGVAESNGVIQALQRDLAIAG